MSGPGSYTIPIAKGMVVAASTLNISPKHALVICRAINHKSLSQANKILEGLARCTTPLPRQQHRGRKYFSKAATQIAGLLKAAAANTRARGLEPDAMELLISAHRGPTRYRGRHKRRLGLRLKITHVQAILKPGEEKR